MPKESDFTKERINPLCQNPELWSAEDYEASENEVADFLYGLVRLLKPGTIVETGCYKGNATKAIANAVRENGFGDFFSCDINGEYVGQVKDMLRLANLPGLITPVSGETLLKNLPSVDFAFIDSGGEDREAEIELLLPLMKPYSIFCLHDTAPQHEKLARLSEKIKLPKVYLNTPRGLTIFQKI
jgi:predicted O-methyltransferase YrrM